MARGCGAGRTHLDKVEHRDEHSTPAVQAVQVRVALLPVVVEHRHQAWAGQQGSREDRPVGEERGR